MKTWLTPIAALALAAAPAPLGQAPEQEAESAAPLGQAAAQKKVYVVPVRDDIMPPILYVIRRGVKEAMAAGADCLILDMETNGGRVDITEEIFDIIGKFSDRQRADHLQGRRTLVPHRDIRPSLLPGRQ